MLLINSKHTFIKIYRLDNFMCALFTYLTLGFMTTINAHTFTTEQQLTSSYTNEIATFWKQGTFEHFIGANEKRINYATFRQDVNKDTSDITRKCLVISPGRRESYLKYKELSFDFFKLGFDIFIIDHRGQGLSERLLPNSYKGYVDNFQYYVVDLAQFISNIVQPHCDKIDNSSKPYLLAHSMGGAIAARYLQDYPNTIEAAVLSSPMFGFNSGGIPKFLAKPLIEVIDQINQWADNSPWYFLGQNDTSQDDFQENLLTHSFIRFQQFSKLYSNTPAIQLGGVTLKWLTESTKALQIIFDGLDKITTPTLVLQSGADKIVSNTSQNDFCKELHKVQPQSCPNGKPVIIENAYHELFFESDIYRRQALLTVTQWFERHK